MSHSLPPTSEIRKSLGALGHAEIQALSSVSGVPFTTLWKIRDGTTQNPGLETVRQFWPELKKRKDSPKPKAVEA